MFVVVVLLFVSVPFVTCLIVSSMCFVIVFGCVFVVRFSCYVLCLRFVCYVFDCLFDVFCFFCDGYVFVLRFLFEVLLSVLFVLLCC